MSKALQENAVVRVESFIPEASIQVDPLRPSVYGLRLFEVWDRSGRVRGRFTTNAEGEFVGGTVLVDREPIGYQDLSAFAAGLRIGGGW